MITAIERASNRRWFTFAISAFLATAVAACGDAVSDVPEQEIADHDVAFATAPTTISINPTSAVLAASAVLPMSALDQNGQALPVQWSTTNPAIATVSIDGVVTARSVGKAVISARWGNQAAYTANSYVEVRANIAPATVSLLPAGGSVGIGQKIRVVARDQNGVILPVQWHTTNPTVASITSTGMLTGNRLGRVTVG